MNIKLDGTDQRLWQWDKGRRVILDEIAPGTQIDFAHYDEKRAICKTAYAEDGVIYVDIPNILLQKAEHIYLYTYIVVGDTGKTSEYGELRVRKRPKPGDYVYEETEVLTWHALDKRIKALEQGGGGSGAGGGLIIDSDGVGNVTITATGGASITSDGAGNVVIV